MQKTPNIPISNKCFSAGVVTDKSRRQLYNKQGGYYERLRSYGKEKQGRG